jgi:hypothetical protein
MTAIIRAYDAQVDSVDKADRSMVARINSSALDRLNSVIDPRGGMLENYRKNPIVLWEHGKDPRRFTDPIGRNMWIKHNGGRRPAELLARTKFLDDDFSQQRFEWYRDGTLNAFSVRILPLESGPPTREEIAERPELNNGLPNETRGIFDGPLMYRKWELAEYSCTSIPGNADCLVSERAAKMLDLVARNLLWVPDEVMPLIEAARAADGPDNVPDTAPDNAPAEIPAPIEPGGRPIVEIARALADERRILKQSLRDEVMATLDLYLFGRV